MNESLVVDNSRINTKEHNVLPKSHNASTQNNKLLNTNSLEIFARVLSSLLQGGVPILKALDGLQCADYNQRYKTMLSHVRESIKQGANLSTALEQSNHVPAIFYQTVYAGEISGKVPEVLEDVSKYLLKEINLKKSIRDSLIYPSFILGVGIFTLGVMMCFVLPRLKIVYDDFGMDLPWITQLILNSSQYLIPCFILLLGITTFVITTKRAKTCCFDLAQKFIFTRQLIHQYFRIRFTRLLHLLGESGIPVLESLNIIESTFTNSLIKKDISIMKRFVSSGNGLSDSIKHIVWMDPVSKMLIVSGEESGRLDMAFYQIARDTERSLESQITLTVKLIEPLLILIIGLSVGLIVVATVLPIFDMSKLL